MSAHLCESAYTRQSYVSVRAEAVWMKEMRLCQVRAYVINGSCVPLYTNLRWSRDDHLRTTSTIPTYLCCTYVRGVAEVSSTRSTQTSNI